MPDGAGRGRREEAPPRVPRRADARTHSAQVPGSLPVAMPSYTVTVATGSQWFAGTDDYIYLSLVGSAGCSEKHLLDKPFYNDFERGAVRARPGPGWGERGPRRGSRDLAGLSGRDRWGRVQDRVSAAGIQVRGRGLPR